LGDDGNRWSARGLAESAGTLNAFALSGDGSLDLVTAVKDLFKVGLLARGIQVDAAMANKW